MRLFILGLPGSGKGTISNLLKQQDSRVAYFNVGEILRQKSSEDAHIKQVHAAGGLVNSDRVFGIFEEALTNDHFICDGSPRKAKEADFILSHPNWQRNPGMLVYLKIPENVAYDRLLKRKRFDDDENIIENRIKAFNEETILSIAKFEFANNLIVVDGTLNPKQITSFIIKNIQ